MDLRQGRGHRRRAQRWRSNFRICGYDDAGSSTAWRWDSPQHWRKVTVGSFSTAGLEISGGPTWTVGTGVPSHSTERQRCTVAPGRHRGTTLYVRESASSWVGTGEGAPVNNDGAFATVEQGSLQQAQQLAIGIVSTFLSDGRWHPTGHLRPGRGRHVDR